MADDPTGGAAERVVVAVDVEDTPWCATGPDLVADRLFSLGASAVSELSGPTVRLVADLPIASLGALIDSGSTFDVLEADPSWNAGWRDHAVAVPVGERFVLRPEWVEAHVDPTSTAGDRIEVVLDAADAFGSGSHPTTRLCLVSLERLVGASDRPALRVLDVGCGTGVLGVAALRLVADGSLVAVDVEPAAVGATRRTAVLNGVADRVVEVSDRPVDEVVAAHGRFDVVLANLLVPIIEQLGSALGAAVAPGGHLVLSGLLSDPATGQVDRAVSAVGAHLALEDVLHADGWAAVVLHRAD